LTELYSLGVVTAEAAQLKRSQVTDLAKHNDIRSVGLIMIELMEPRTSALRPQRLKLQDPRAWEAGEIINFLTDTETKSLQQLTQRPFLEEANGDNLPALVAFTWATVWEDIKIEKRT
jgi:hypothetical protein